MVWVVDTRNNYEVYPLEEKQDEYLDGVLEFSKAADSSVYECTGSGEKKHVHVIMWDGVATGDVCDVKAFAEALLVADKPRVFAGYLAVLHDGEMKPYSIRERKFVTEMEFMTDLDSDGYPLREIVDFLRRMKGVTTGGYNASRYAYSGGRGCWC